VRPGAITQNIFTLLKLTALAILIGTGLAFIPGAPPSGTLPSLGSNQLTLAFGAALVPVLFAFGGWQQTNFVAEELIDPERNLPRALVAGVIIVIAVYLLANVAYLRTLGVSGLAGSSAPAADAVSSVFGARGRGIIAAGIAVSTFGFLNLVILVSPRVYQAMARDGLFFPSLARLHPRYHTPAAAIVFQAAWAIVLTMTGRYGLRRLDLFCRSGIDCLRLPFSRTKRSGDREPALPHAGVPDPAAGLHFGGDVRSAGISRIESG
jgi:APA family basic amino acid/polyamine antiporter